MRLFLLLAFSACMLLATHGFNDSTDRQALLEFKSQVSDEKKDALSSWNNSSPLCSWFGVTCGRKHKRVTRLELRGLKLGGVISPSIGNLSFLNFLNLTDNSFHGTIPQEVGDLFRLEYLNLGLNFLEGVIPASLYNCTRLLSLRLAINHLGQGISSELGSLTKLKFLDLSRNNLEGKIPAPLGNLTSLSLLDFAQNNLDGGIPDDMARLTQLKVISLSTNNFSGFFPPVFDNRSSLEHLDIFQNSFFGSLRSEFGNLLPKLQVLAMGHNGFTGAIPAALVNISTLQNFGMEENNMRGSISPTFGRLQNLQQLFLNENHLGSHSYGDLDFLGALTNCTNLQILYLSWNRLGGDLPTSIANLSTNLTYLDLSKNRISGSIPRDIGNLISLQSLGIEGNMLTGSLPPSLGKLSELVVLALRLNRMSGKIPSSLGNNTRLVKLYLSHNSLEGNIPPSLSNYSYLLEIALGGNNLNGRIPWGIMQIPTLVNLGLQHNYLTGSLPKAIGRNLVRLYVENNKLSGHLPDFLGNCLSMEELRMQGNSFVGGIPDIRMLVAVTTVDLSDNNLSGTIPTYLASFSKLQYPNLSINNFEGRVPTEGIFQNASIVSVSGNKNLCGGIKRFQLKPCPIQAQPMEKSHSSRLKKIVIGVSVSILLLLLLFVTSISLWCWFKRRKKNQHLNNPTPVLGGIHEQISYGDLRNATNGFSSRNIIGSGSFGTVFKAFLPAEDKVVAVKVLNLQRRGAMKSFMAECESLKSIRHRNLVKLLTACSSIDFQGNEFRALIYEFMPNGSLDMWLHPEEVEETHRPSRTLTLFERLNIAVDVASLLDYLHAHCHDPIAHCDIKPSNVLLDDDITAHVSDFGLARLLLKFDRESFLDQLSSAGVRGTIGYVAPEFGMGGQPSIFGDVYSFGVLLLEMFTGKRPTNDLFGGNFTLQIYTKSALPERVLSIADKSILQNGLRVGFPIVECLKLVLEVGLRCCEESPTNRLAMSEAVNELVSIKERFFKARRTMRR